MIITIISVFGHGANIYLEIKRILQIITRVTQLFQDTRQQLIFMESFKMDVLCLKQAKTIATLKLLKMKPNLFVCLLMAAAIAVFQKIKET